MEHCDGPVYRYPLNSVIAVYPLPPLPSRISMAVSHDRSCIFVDVDLMPVFGACDCSRISGRSVTALKRRGSALAR